MKERNFTFMFLIFLVLICLAFPQALRSQVVSVGSGSYTTVLPPADAAERNQYPAGKPRVSRLAATKPIATSDWWTGLLTYNGVYVVLIADESGITTRKFIIE